MPQPKNRRRAPTVAVGIPSSSWCLCGEQDGGWSTAAPIRVVHDLQLLREFYSSLKPAARASVLKTTPLSEVLPQVVEASDLGLEEAQSLVAGSCGLSNPALVSGVRAFFERVLEGDCELVSNGSAQPGLRMSDELLQVVYAQIGDGTLGERFGGCVPSTHAVIPSKQGLVRFPTASQQNPEAAAGVKEATQQGVCRPSHDIHYRPWTDAPELVLYRGMLDCCRLLGGLVVVLQRRLHRAMMRAKLVRALAASGPATPSLPIANACQTWSWGVGAQGQLGLGAVRQADTPTPIPALSDQRVVQLAAAGNHAFARTAEGVLLSWGGGQYGVSGLHDQEASRVPLPCSAVAYTPQGRARPVTQVATGDLHTLAVQGGLITAWGSAWLGQLGNTEAMMGGGCLLPYDEEEHELLTNLTPGLSFSPDYLQALEPGTSTPVQMDGEGPNGESSVRHPACLTMLTGQTAMSGPFMDKDKKSTKRGALLTDVVAVAAGGMHSVAATSDGGCWVWGCNEAGCLGVGVTEEDLQQPWVQAMGCGCCDGKDMVVISVSAPVEVDLDGVVNGKVVAVAAGHAISVALTDEGEVVSWGASRKLPWQVDKVFAEGDRGVAVAAGGPYALAVTSKTGSVWVWQRHHMMEWNLDPDQPMPNRAQVQKPWLPRKVPFLSGVQHAACSSTHGVAATCDGRVYWWPHSAVITPGQQQAVPVQSYEVVTLRGLSVLSVAAGDNFAVCATGLPLPAAAQQQEQHEEASEDTEELDLPPLEDLEVTPVQTSVA